MTQKIILLFALILIGLSGIVSCKDQPAVCQPVTPLFSVAEAISDQDHPCREWLSMLQGRVAANSSQSASIWTLHTETGTGLVISALHTLGEGYLGPGGSLIEKKFRDPTEQPGATRIFLVEDNRASVSGLATVLFILFNPEVPPEESGNHLRDIIPRHDFFVGVIDSQKIVMDPFPGAPAPIKHEPPVVIDPAGLLTGEPTFATGSGGDTVVMIGFPQTGEFAGVMAASIGSVLSDDEAEAVIDDLAELGDEEGEIAYESEVEMIIEGHAAVGMSGGGVYDRDGRQVGILVRASDEHGGRQYIRAVRMTYVVSVLQTAFESLTAAEKAVIGRYLPVSFDGT